MSMKMIQTAIVISLAIGLGWGINAPGAQMHNAAFRVSASVNDDGAVVVRVDNRVTGRRAADGPYFFRAVKSDDKTKTYILEDAAVSVEKETIVVRGRLAGLDIQQTLSLPTDRPILEERILVRNGTQSVVSLSEFEAGFTLRVMDTAGNILPEMAGDRWVAVPFLRRADYGEYRNLPSTDAFPLKRDPRDIEYDFTLRTLLDQPGFEYVPQVDVMNFDPKRVASPHRFSEGWAWMQDKRTMGVFSFNQEHMVFATVTPHDSPSGKFLRFGGGCLLETTLGALRNVQPGQSVDLGLTRIQPIDGGYNETAYAFREMLDEKGCRFPADYNPPVHWEQYFEMMNIPGDRDKVYTRAALEKQAAKGVEFSCEALYLDPGWDTSFGSFLWGPWLGEQKDFFNLLRTKYGLAAGLHFPMPPWASPSEKYVSEWPDSCRRLPNKPIAMLQMPAIRDGRRNLALLPEAKAEASSVISSPSHRIHGLNDGRYGNPGSWIANSLPAWAQIDLGAVYEVSRVVIGNDHAGQFTDRSATRLKVLGATAPGEKPEGANWRVLAEYSQRLKREAVIDFSPTQARWIRLEISESQEGEPRLDEIEIYEARPATTAEAETHVQSVRRRCASAVVQQIPNNQPWVCMGSKQYLDEAEKRILKCCEAGAVFLMFDGTWWNGPCFDERHGHPIPYTYEDHIRTCVALARRIHAKFPKVLIEMHDMLAGGEWRRMTPVYYKYGLPGSYDENWGFELMWHAMKNLKEGTSDALYYYALGCNVPMYLHIELEGDNEHAVSLWWYASTCRHLGIGAKPKNPAVAAAQIKAMKQYRKWEEFYKRGEFYGINREIHLHVLPEKKAFTVNVFNLSGKKRTIEGSIDLKTLGLDPALKYVSSDDLGKVENGRYHIGVELPPWGAKAAEFHGAGRISQCGLPTADRQNNDAK